MIANTAASPVPADLLEAIYNTDTIRSQANAERFGADQASDGPGRVYRQARDLLLSLLDVAYGLDAADVYETMIDSGVTARVAARHIADKRDAARGDVAAAEQTDCHTRHPGSCYGVGPDLAALLPAILAHVLPALRTHIANTSRWDADYVTTQGHFGAPDHEQITGFTFAFEGAYGWTDTIPEHVYDLAATHGVYLEGRTGWNVGLYVA